MEKGVSVPLSASEANCKLWVGFQAAHNNSRNFYRRFSVGLTAVAPVKCACPNKTLGTFDDTDKVYVTFYN